MQVTNDKPSKLVMSRWEYLFFCLMYYGVGYVTGKEGLAKILPIDRDAPLWPLILALLVFAWMMWMMRKAGARSG